MYMTSKRKDILSSLFKLISDVSYKMFDSYHSGSNQCYMQWFKLEHDCWKRKHAHSYVT